MAVGRARRAEHKMSHAEQAARAQGGTLMRCYRHPYNAGQHNKKSVRSKHPRGLALAPPTQAAAATTMLPAFNVNSINALLGLAVFGLAVLLRVW